MPMSPLSQHSVRLQRLLVAAVVFLLGVLMATVLAIEYQQVRRSETDRLITQARLVSQNLELHMSSANQALEETRALLDFLPAEEQLDRMQSLVNAMPIIRAMGVLDSEGMAVVNTRRVAPGTDFSDRPYFLNVRDDPQLQRLYISTPFRGVTGVVSIALSKALFDHQNEFRGVIFAVLEPEYIERLLHSTLYTADMWATLMYVQGGDAVRVGALPPKAYREANPVDVTLQQRLPDLLRQATIALHDSPRSIDEAFMAASLITSSAGATSRPLVVVTGRDYREAMGAWRRLAYQQGTLFILIAFTSGAGLVFYQRRRRQYEFRQASDERRVRAREHDYRVIVERTADWVVRLDRQGRYSYVNPAFCAAFGKSADQFIGVDFSEQVTDSEPDRTLVRASITNTLAHATEERFHVECPTPQGRRHMEWTLCSFEGDEGTISSVIGVGRDVTAHINIRDELRNRAFHDSLTGLANRGYFRELANAEISRSHRYAQPLALMMIDLDHFKKVNDTYGHHIGDVALQTCAAVLSRERREFDVVGRLGGEEFTLLLPNTSEDDAMKVAERLRKAISEQAIEHDDHRFHVTTSIGVAMLQPNEGIDELLQRADMALYAAKRAGRNRVERAAADPSLPSTEQSM